MTYDLDRVQSEDLKLGERYDFHTTHDTVYENAKYKGRTDSGGIGIFWKGMAYIVIAPHEFSYAKWVG